MSSMIYKTSAIEMFDVTMNSYDGSYVFVPHQKCIIERRFLPDILTVVKSGWYSSEDVDKEFNVPINIKKCLPVVNEEQYVYINGGIGSTPDNWIYFEQSNFKKWLMRNAHKEWYHCEFTTDSSRHKVEKIDVYEKGQIVIKTAGDNWIVGLKNIQDDEHVKEVAAKVAYAIEAYPYFKLDGCDLIFLTADLKEEYKI